MAGFIASISSLARLVFPRRDAGKPHQSQSTTNPNAPSSTNPISRNDPAESVPSLFQSQIPPPSTSGTPVHPSASSSTQIMPRVTPTPAAAPLSHEPTRPSEGANANVPQIQARVSQKTNLASTSSAFVSSSTHSSSPSSSHASSDHLGSQAAHSPAPAISAQALGILLPSAAVHTSPASFPTSSIGPLRACLSVLTVSIACLKLVAFTVVFGYSPAPQVLVLLSPPSLLQSKLVPPACGRAPAPPSRHPDSMPDLISHSGPYLPAPPRSISSSSSTSSPS
ncbi:hypothetical protein DL93DRAFT_2169866 [Clavulina sp. PMI_390]|nr:hypothetical protein DL93DRAFT_2169866 [Clavulina sp. PMI_390]